MPYFSLLSHTFALAPPINLTFPLICFFFLYKFSCIEQIKENYFTAIVSLKNFVLHEKSRHDQHGPDLLAQPENYRVLVELINVGLAQPDIMTDFYALGPAEPSPPFDHVWFWA